MSKLDDIVSEAFRRVPLAGKTNFEHEEQLAREAARLALEEAAKVSDRATYRAGVDNTEVYLTCGCGPRIAREIRRLKEGS